MNKSKYFYVYKITNLSNNKKYIGWRTSNKPPIKDLGIYYFSTSSDEDFIYEQLSNAKNFRYEIIKECTTAKEAVYLEDKLLNEVNAKDNFEYYNKSNGCRWFYDTTGSIWITDGKKDIKIHKNHPPSLLSEYLCKGFYKGRSFGGEHPSKNKMMIHKHNKETGKTAQKMIFDFEIDFYLDKGYKIGGMPQGFRFYVYCGNKQKHFKTEKERDKWLEEKNKGAVTSAGIWKIGQFERVSFTTKGITPVTNIKTLKNETIDSKLYDKMKFKTYLSRSISISNRDYGFLYNEYRDILFEGYLAELNSICSIKINNKINTTTLKKGSNNYDFVKKINDSSFTVTWHTTKTWDEHINEINERKNLSSKTLKNSDIANLRSKLLIKQNNFCPICNTKIKPGDENLDHDHDTGKIRGVLCRTCNSGIEGAFRGKWVRSGLSKKISLEELLLNLYNYLSKDHFPILHPTHAPKPNKLMKRSYNSLKKEVNKCNSYLKKPIKMPDYPRSGRLTKKLKELYNKMGIYPEFYGSNR